MSIKYQFNTQITTPKNDTLIAITPHHSVEVLSKEHVLLSHTDKQQSIVLANYLVNVIEVLKTFRTLSDHVTEIRQFMQLDKSAAKEIEKVIKQLQQSGFIIIADGLVDNIQLNNNRNPLQTPPIVVVRTSGRVTLFHRFLQSAIENEYRFNARYEYFIIDDSKPEHAEANAVNIEKSGLNCRHITKHVQEKIIEKFLLQFPESRQQINYLLGEHPLHKLSITYGRTWNWGVLLTAGKPVVFLDDDCILQPYEPPFKTDRHIHLGNVGQEVSFLSKDQTLESQLRTIALDPIAQLAQFLGETPKQLPYDTSSFVEADYQIGEKLSKAHIMVSSPAVAGDPGSASPLWLYFTRGDSARRFWGKDSQEYSRHKTERYLWVGNTKPSIAFGGKYSVVARAFDNRKLLPPTLPIFRSEDTLFTNLIHYLYPYGVSLSTTWGLGHQPEIEREWQDSDSQHAKDFDLIKALDDFIDTSDSIPQNAMSPTERLNLLATKMQQSFSADPLVIQRWLYSHQQGRRASQVCALQNALESAGNNAPTYWQKDVNKIIDANIQGEQALSFGELSSQNAIETLQLFGEALPIWLQLWENCKTSNPLSGIR